MQRTISLILCLALLLLSPGDSFFAAWAAGAPKDGITRSEASVPGAADHVAPVREQLFGLEDAVETPVESVSDLPIERVGEGDETAVSLAEQGAIVASAPGASATTGPKIPAAMGETGSRSNGQSPKIDFDGQDSGHGTWNERTVLEVDAQSLLIDTNYAGLAVKKRDFLDWAKLRAKMRETMLKAASPREAYYAYAEMFGAFKDAHISVTLLSDYVKKLPLEFAHEDGVTFISYIDRDKLPKDKFPFTVGDALVKFDGKTPDEVRAELAPVESVGNELTDLSMLTPYISVRSERRGIRPPAGDSAKIVIDSGAGPVEYTIPWQTSGIPIHGGEGFGSGGPSQTLSLDQLAPKVPQPAQAGKAKPASGFFARWVIQRFGPLDGLFRDFHQLMNTSIAVHEEHQADPAGSAKTSKNVEGQKFELGAQKPFFKLPADFKKIELPFILRIMGASNIFAGTFVRNGKRIGFMRIPSYEMGESATGLVFGVMALRYYFSVLQEQSDRLFIDQSNNPGGMVVMTDWIVDLLTGGNYSYTSMRYAIKPTQDWIRQYANLYSSLLEKHGSTMSDEEQNGFKAEFKKNHDIILNAYNNQKELSEPISMAVMSRYFERTMFGTLEPFMLLLRVIPGMGRALKKVPYGKEVVMYITELCFSGGDATPATLQDNGIRLVGTNTAGAGGSVGEFENSIVNHFKFRLTQSLMLRKNDSFVENKGVKADVQVRPTRQDYRNGFSSFFDRLLSSIGW